MIDRLRRAAAPLVLAAAFLPALTARALEPGTGRARIEALAQVAPGLDRNER